MYKSYYVYNTPYYQPYNNQRLPVSTNILNVDPKQLGRIGELSNQIVLNLFQQYQSSGIEPLDFAQKN